MGFSTDQIIIVQTKVYEKKTLVVVEYEVYKVNVFLIVSNVHIWIFLYQIFTNFVHDWRVHSDVASTNYNYDFVNLIYLFDKHNVFNYDTCNCYKIVQFFSNFNDKFFVNSVFQ